MEARLSRALALLLAALALAGHAAGLGARVEAAQEDAPVPLVGRAPAWWTPELADEVDRASDAGLAYDRAAGAPVDLAVAYPSQVLLRPGTALVIGNARADRSVDLCTAAFTFDQRTLLSTAGHCVAVGEAVYAVAAPQPVVFRVGLAVASTGDRGVGDDWALVAIDPAWRPYTDSDAALVGGPHGSATDLPAPGALVKHVGHGRGVGAGGTARVGSFSGGNDTAFRFVGAAQPGDSGGPVLLVGTPGGADDAALGILTHSGTGVVRHGDQGATCQCGAFGTRVTRIPATLDEGDGLPL